ncbi:MAG: DUF4328 domain-containing protein [Actinobacteria bacterium]|nr:DUF4328 domain-containing protein [Actinomycetota bacterium]
MPRCGFCGQDNIEGARSCVACGNIFGAEPEPPGDPDLFGELVSLATPSPETESTSPARERARLANLFDRDPVVASSRQVLIMVGVALILAASAAIAVVVDAADALRTLDEVGGGTLLVGGLSVAPRTDLLSLAEVSPVAGVLVMLGGWSQQVAANRALLDVSSPTHSARWALTAWLIPGANVALPGVLVRELWADTTPPGGNTARPRAVAIWPLIFGVALSARYAALLFGFFAAPDIEERSDAILTASVLVGALALWMAALALTIVVIRHVTQRLLARADALRG